MTLPLICTRPCSIISSALRRLATPAWESIFCRRSSLAGGRGLGMNSGSASSSSDSSESVSVLGSESETSGVSSVADSDGVFNRYNVACFAPVDFVHQGSESRGLPGAGRSADDHQPALQLRQGCDSRRQTKFVERRYLGGKSPNRGSRPSSFAMQIDAETTPR